MSMIGHNLSPLRSFADRILRLEDDIKAINSDKSEVYKEAKANGFDMKALRNTIRRYRDLTGDKRHEVLERDAIEEIYLAEMMREDGTNVALARTHERPFTVSESHSAADPAAVTDSADDPPAHDGGVSPAPPFPIDDAGPIPEFLRRTA